MYERAGNPVLALEDCGTVLDLDPSSAKARLKRSRILEGEGMYDEALAELCAVQLMFMHDNKDKLRLGVDVGQPPVDQTKMEEVCEKCIPKNFLDASQRKTDYLKQLEKDNVLNLPTAHTIDMFLESFSSYKTWVNESTKDDIQQLSIELARSDITDAERTDLLFRRGRKSAATKKYKEAHADFAQAAQSLNDDATYYLDVIEWLGIYKHLTYNLKDALLFYTRVLEARQKLAETDAGVNSKVADILVKIAGIHMDMADTDAAKVNFDLALKASPSCPDALLHRSNLHLQGQDIKAAHADIEKCLELKPDFLPAVLRQVTLCMHEQNQNGAKELLKKASRMAPGSSDVHIYRGELAFTEGDVVGALKAFEKALECDKSNPNAYVNAALAILNQPPSDGGMPDFIRARDFLEKGIELDPQFQGAYVHLGQLCLTLAQNVSECKEVVDLYDSGMNQSKNDAELKELLRMRIMAQAQYEAASSLGIMS